MRIFPTIILFNSLLYIKAYRPGFIYIEVTFYLNLLIGHVFFILSKYSKNSFKDSTWFFMRRYIGSLEMLEIGI